MSANETTTLAELKTLLAQERDVIRTADFARLGSLVQRKQDLIDALAGTPTAALGNIRAEAEQNQRLLEAALRGVRNAQIRLQQIREGARGFTGYDRHGQAQHITRAEGTVEMRA
ncbi:hypothetical protein [Paenirhodobacter sp.]|uniref:hypothetical protein n=1 Tax=Paenirhodobacter sp. TaxID=1965326 RepID=UPI003B3D0033